VPPAAQRKAVSRATVGSSTRKDTPLVEVMESIRFWCLLLAAILACSKNPHPDAPGTKSTSATNGAVQVPASAPRASQAEIESKLASALEAELNGIEIDQSAALELRSMVERGSNASPTLTPMRAS